MTVLAALQLIALAGLAFVLFASALTSCGVSWALSGTAGWAPEPRHRALLLLGTAPMIVAFVALLAALAPSLLALIGPEHDHCLTHGDGHVHLCLLHPPQHLGNVASLVALALGLGWLSVRAGGALIALRRAARCLEGLRRQSVEDSRLGASVLPTSIPLCALAGVLRPTLFLSAGLLAKLSSCDMPVILHHEHAHASRRDLLLLLLARAGSVAMWPAARARLLAALQLAAEQSCDEAAASRVGDRLEVAAVILKVERLLQSATEELGALAIAFGGNSVPERVSSLLQERRSRGNPGGAMLALALLLGGLLVISAPLHHFTESILGTLTH